MQANLRDVASGLGGDNKEAFSIEFQYNYLAAVKGVRKDAAFVEKGVENLVELTVCCHSVSTTDL